MGSLLDVMVNQVNEKRRGDANAAKTERNRKMMIDEDASHRNPKAPYSSYRRDADAQYEATRNGTRPAKVAPDPAPSRASPKLPASTFGGILGEAAGKLKNRPMDLEDNLKNME